MHFDMSKHCQKYMQLVYKRMMKDLFRSIWLVLINFLYYIREMNVKVMIFTLYLVQSLFFGFYFSLPLTYTEVPDYQTLGLFAAAMLPYSLKFIMAPIAECYYIRSYGKRKTWIVFNLLILAVIALLLGETVGVNQYQFVTAVLLMLSMVASAMKDVSTDALTLGHIQNPTTAFNIEFSAIQFGKILGLSIFLALISKGYWSSYGIHHAIISAKTFMWAVSALIIIFVIIIHFQFKQSSHRKQTEQTEKQQGIKQVVSHYRHFLMPKYQLFRLSIFLLVVNHGIIYFRDTYQYEFIRKNLIQRETLMFLGDLCLIPNLIVSYLLGKTVRKENVYRIYWYLFISTVLIEIAVYMADLQKPNLIMGASALIKVSMCMQYQMRYCLISDACKGNNSAINFTGLLSVMNVGVNSALQNQVIFMIGYDRAMVLGFSIAAVTAAVFPFLGSWIRNGQKTEAIKDQ